MSSDPPDIVLTDILLRLKGVPSDEQLTTLLTTIVCLSHERLNAALAEPGAYQREQAAQLLALKRIEEFITADQTLNWPRSSTTSIERLRTMTRPRLHE